MGDVPANSQSKPVSLIEITAENLKSVLQLSVGEEQKKVYPRSNAYSIAEGHYPGDDDPVWIQAIYAGEEPVGFLMTSEAPERGEYFLWRLMIDARHQRKGYGCRAVELLIERIENSPNPRFLMTSHLKGDGDAGVFYEKLGFVYTGEILGDNDHVMRIDFGGRWDATSTHPVRRRGKAQVKQVFAHYERDGPLEGGFKYCPFCSTPLVVEVIGHRPRPACPSCGYVQHRNPAPTVSVLVVDGDRVLLGKRGGHPGKGTWSLPSGYVDYEEDFLTTAIRETREETGLVVEVCSILNLVSSFVSPRFHFLGIYVLARVVGGEPVAGDDLEAVAWFPLAGSLPEMGFQEDVTIIEMVERGFEGLPVDPDYATP